MVKCERKLSFRSSISLIKLNWFQMEQDPTIVCRCPHALIFGYVGREFRSIDRLPHILCWQGTPIHRSVTTHPLLVGHSIPFIDYHTSSVEHLIFDTNHKLPLNFLYVRPVFSQSAVGRCAWRSHRICLSVGISSWKDISSSIRNQLMSDRRVSSCCKRPAVASDQPLRVEKLRRFDKLERQRFEWSALNQLLVVTDLCCSDFVVAAVCGNCSSGAGEDARASDNTALSSPCWPVSPHAPSDSSFVLSPLAWQCSCNELRVMLDLLEIVARADVKPCRVAFADLIFQEEVIVQERDHFLVIVQQSNLSRV
ncbi:HXXXD-type acyl-transferase family protein [Dorcoceras hygrometricum]|uniref:HXXXD-type acyl-transferase family protein n=1 Tax=Dorcoceras hygrometricum TaxID=472368 RepID=A0A2Z7AI51_9LAMI|nr:HXXXD-type acyl-transferase family protein [Dorcoceras hygrometricum]